jgi:serine/threonine-protein kinase HipA
MAGDSRTLHVYWRGQMVGELLDAGSHVEFTYAPGWLDDEGAEPLAPGIPLDGGGAQRSDAVQAFFENLLPEGSVREFIGRAIQVSPGNVFGMLERLGGDTAGAVSLVPAGETPSEEPRYVPVTAKQVCEWIRLWRGAPLTDMQGESARMSLSGAQDKITLRIDDGTMMLPLGTAPSTHIVKPSIDHRVDVRNTAVNETLVMTLAAEIGLTVPYVRYDADLDAAVIDRYDRVRIESGRVELMDSLDVCQALGIPSGRKYEAEGGPSLVDVFDLVQRMCARPAAAKKRLIQWVAFNLAVGNMDGHAKNLSLVQGERGWELAPFYDLLCTSAYPALSKKFAFSIGGCNKPKWIVQRHWERFATQLGMKPRYVLGEIEAIFDRVEARLPSVVAFLRLQMPPETHGTVSVTESAIAECTRVQRSRYRLERIIDPLLADDEAEDQADNKADEASPPPAASALRLSGMR